jgi:hypothetical protein
MNKQDMVRLTMDLENGVPTPNSSMLDENPMDGLYLPDFPDRKPVSYDAALSFLRWHCVYMNGNINQTELSEMLEVMRRKRVMILG